MTASGELLQGNCRSIWAPPLASSEACGYFIELSSLHSGSERGAPGLQHIGNDAAYFFDRHRSKSSSDSPQTVKLPCPKPVSQ